VLGMVQARLDALGAECKLVLRAASVFGRAFTRSGVAHLCGGEERAAGVATALEELQAREVVTQRAAPAGAKAGNVEYVFRQALVREAAYAMLPDEDRALGHRLAGAWLEEAGATDATVLAEHYDRGGEPQRAIGWYRRGAEDALHGNDFVAAVARADRGIACGAEGAVLGALRLVQAEAHRWSGRTSEALACATEAAGLLPTGGESWYRAISELCTAHGRRGDYGELEIIVAYVGNFACEGDQVSAHVAALCPAAGQLTQAGRYAAADAAYESMEALVRSTDAELDRIALARLDQFRAFRAVRSGDLVAARDGYGKAAAAFEAAGNARNACIDRINYAFASIELGDMAEAETVLRQSAAASERMALDTVHAFALLNLGRVLMMTGRLDEARDVELGVLAIGKRDKSPRMEGAARLHLSNIFRRAGDLVFSEQEARAARELLVVAPPLRAGALAALARALLALGRAREAIEPAREAREIVGRGQRDMFDTMVRLTWAEVLAATGEEATARGALEEAWRELHRCLRFIPDAATRERFLRLEDNARTLELARAAGLVAEADLLQAG
jgi:eukaryotic-like serine/threonine-protein kinase